MALKRISLWIIVLAILVAAVPATAGTSSERVTVGEFLTRIAGSMQLANGSGDQALASLRARGFDIPAMPMDRNLTQGDVVSIAGALGQQVSSTVPASPFTGTDVDLFLDSFSQDLEKSVASGDGTEGDTKSDKPKVDPRTKGKGKKKGLYKKSPSEPI